MPRVLSASSWLRILRAAVATVGMGLAVWLVSLHSGLVVQVGTGVVTFVALGALLRIVPDDEMAELRHLAGMLRRR